MKENEIIKLIEMFTRETAVNICTVCEKTRVADIYCKIPSCEKKDFYAWKTTILAVIHEMINKKRNLMRARATNKNEITLYFDEGR